MHFVHYAIPIGIYFLWRSIESERYYELSVQINVSCMSKSEAVPISDTPSVEERRSYITQIVRNPKRDELTMETTLLLCDPFIVQPFYFRDTLVIEQPLLLSNPFY